MQMSSEQASRSRVDVAGKMKAKGKRPEDLIALSLVLLMAASVPAHEPPVDHIDREAEMWVEDGRLWLRYQISLPPRAAMMQIFEMDKNMNGTVEEQEREIFFTSFGQKLASLLRLDLNGKRLKLEPAGQVKLSPPQKQTWLFATPAGALKPGKYSGQLLDRFSLNYAGFYRYVRSREKAESSRIAVSASQKIESRFRHPNMVVLQFSMEVPE